MVLACSLCMRPLEVYSENTRHMYKSIVVHFTGQSRLTFFYFFCNELGVNLFWNLDVAGQNTTLKGKSLESIEKIALGVGARTVYKGLHKWPNRTIGKQHNCKQCP